MPDSLRSAPAVLAALLGAALAAFVLTDPPGGRWAVSTSDRELDRWLTAQPTGIAAGAVVAVGVCALMQRGGSRRIAWLTAAAATAVTVLIRVAVPGVAGVDTLVALHVVKSLAAGTLLGAAAAGSWGHRIPQIALALGTVAGFLSVTSWGAATATQSTSTLGEPSQWVLALTLAATIAAAALANPSSRIPHITGIEARDALVTITAVAVTNRLLIAWIGRDTGESRLHTWVIVVIATVVVLVVTEVAARLLARRTDPGNAAIVLAATGIAAAAMPVLVDLRGPLRDVSPWAAVAVAGLAVAVGLAVAARRPLPVVGLAVAALVPAAGTLWPDFGAQGPWLLVRLAVVTVGAGIAVGSALPGSAAVATVGLAVPFVSTVFHAAATVIVPTEWGYAPLTNADGGIDFLGSEQFTTLMLGLPHYDDRIAGVVLALAVVFCAWGVHGLRRSR
ncbi:hypothetical protein ACFYVR_19580 [Rhodococcus sp. NPDC003318]|uniref:hypothetical protein n=1 Tax=Rhodococcus sp. NPDC003318 TaxID=3364503 RepID=UPI0036A15493